MRRTTASTIVTAALLWLLAGTNLAAPLYSVYSHRYGFSPIVLTLIFATDAVVVIPSLPVFGQLSDRFGRRPVILAGLGAVIVSLALFALADGVAWLFAARAVQGLAVGLLTGAATAALVELEPSGDTGRAALRATIAQAGGSALGPALAGALAQWGRHGLVLVYLVGIAVTAAIAIAVAIVPEPARERAGHWRMQRPSIPAAIRGSFVRVSLTATAVWSVAGLFLSVVPSYAAQILHEHALAPLGAIIAVMLAASCVGQFAVRRAPGARRTQAAGLALLVLGLVGLVVAQPLNAIAALVAGAVLAGLGHGAGFLAAQDELNRIAPERCRAEVSAAFYACICVGFGLPTIGVGILAALVSLYAGVVVFAVLTGAAAVATAGWHLGAGGLATRRRGAVGQPLNSEG